MGRTTHQSNGMRNLFRHEIVIVKYAVLQRIQAARLWKVKSAYQVMLARGMRVRKQDAPFDLEATLVFR